MKRTEATGPGNSLAGTRAAEAPGEATRPFALPGWILPSVFTAFCEFAEQAAGVYHREARSGRYRLTYDEAKAVCEFEGGRLATYKQLEAARKIGNACDLRIFSFFTSGEGGIAPSCGPFTGSLSRASRSSRSPRELSALWLGPPALPRTRGSS